jgi:hypothetical protein
MILYPIEQVNYIVMSFEAIFGIFAMSLAFACAYYSALPQAVAQPEAERLGRTSLR